MSGTGMRKKVNRLRSTLQRLEGPARKRHDAAPIGDAIRDFWDRGMLSFSIPAHSGGRGPMPEFAKWAGLETARADLPMSHGVDTRDRAWKVQATAQELFADAIGAEQTLFSTNGSSLSARVAILTVAGPGETLVMARNGHKSSFSGLILSGANPVYVDPVYDDELEIALAPLAVEFARVLDAHPDARAGLVFTPSYYGTTAEVGALAEACHERHLPLVTDDAWGLDSELASHPELPSGALAEGSDLAIGSVHKTLSGLSQTSVLSVGSKRIDGERLKLCFELEESTSASALLLSSIDGARRQFVREGDELIERAVGSARLLRTRLAAEVPELRVVAAEELAALDGVCGADPTHVLIETASVGEPEIERLVQGLRDLVDRSDELGAETDVPPLPTRAELRTEQLLSPREAFFSAAEMVDATEAVGRVSAELVTPYPPGIPVAAPGEVYNQAMVYYLEELVAAGGFVQGASDQTLDRLRVVARGP